MRVQVDIVAAQRIFGGREEQRVFAQVRMVAEAVGDGLPEQEWGLSPAIAGCVR